MNLPPVLRQRYFDANGNPLAGGMLYSYQAGTTTPQNTYTDQGGGTANANPVVLDANGEASVWLDPSLSYKFVLKNSSDVTQWTVDNVVGVLTASAVTTASIQTGAVTTDKIATGAVNADKLKNSASVDADRAVTTNHIRDSAVTSGKINDAAVTVPKLADAAIEGVLNVGIAASTASSALTVSLKDASGADPSATSPVKIPFRSSTLATGTVTIRSVTAALSMTVSSGSTLGQASNQAEYVYVYAIDNAGTVELAVSTSNMFQEGLRYSTTAEGGAGGADSRTTLYSTTARANVPVKLLGRIRSTQVTAGTWAAAPTEISVVPFQRSYDPAEVYVENVGGRGSGAAGVYYFSNSKKNTGSDITYTSSTTDGDKFTINREGVYATMFNHQNTAAFNLSITVNSSDLTGVVTSYDSGKRCFAVTDANRSTPLTWTGRLYPGDIVRAQGSATGTTGNSQSAFSICRVGD
jgi:hypothetical protein